ncbi:aldo/keto reductase [Aquibacillus salsiterrae]|uniref:Aldo/keto reductase n=1 Tax=Aquibacillus salsiterrae TaxID=2950439 RepID=A0A9X3WAY4_9BACI|nr:aldo/keto reductase [Aquibacillus salsiterrae]MDC3416060.1 aldo/keto reductase [Aquibacillus salsiterrae]
MKFIKIPGINKRVSKLILGTMTFSPSKMDQVNSLLDSFLESGGNTLDTAHIYNDGKSEKAIGKWLKGRGNRNKVVIIDKGAHPDEYGPRVNPEAITTDLYESLDRLQTDYIDIYMLHRDNPDIPVEVIINTLNDHYNEGRIKAIGVSNWTNQRIEEANNYAKKNGLIGVSANSSNLSLAKPNEPMWPGCISVDECSLNWHEAVQMPLLSWSSQAGGFFTGRYSPNAVSDENIARVYYSEENWERYRRATELSEQIGGNTNQIALAYVLQQPFPISALIGSQNKAELYSSIKALDIHLTTDQLKWLDLRTKCRGRMGRG